MNAVGVDLGGTNLRVALISGAGEIIEKTKLPTTGDVFASLREAITGLRSKAPVSGVGLGVAGLIDRSSSRVISSPNIPSIEGRGLGELDLDIPAFLENDANAAALGESWAGSGRGISNFVLLTLGTGIGGGFVYEGRLMSVPAEVGHMSIKADGEKCPCGSHGCLENYASARGIINAAVAALESGAESLLRECCRGNFYKLTPEDIFKCSLDGDALSREILKDAGKHLGVGIANIVNMLDPDAIILSGGLIGAWDIYVQEAIKEAKKRTLKGLFDKLNILPSGLGDDAGIIGAARLVFQGSGVVAA